MTKLALEPCHKHSRLSLPTAYQLHLDRPTRLDPSLGSQFQQPSWVKQVTARIDKHAPTDAHWRTSYPGSTSSSLVGIIRLWDREDSRRRRLFLNRIVLTRNRKHVYQVERIRLIYRLLLPEPRGNTPSQISTRTSSLVPTQKSIRSLERWKRLVTSST